MTTAPANLKTVRALLLDHLDIHENSSAYPTDLDPAEVGIVGDPAHWGGYHCGSDRVVDGDYSVVESSRDRTGLTGAAAAIDVGQFTIRVGARTHDLRSFSVWLVAQCKASTADSRDIREVIYTADGRTVRRWDRLGIRSSGDDSHLWHTHISYHRDAIKAGRDLTPLFRRYLTEIGLLAGEGPDMDADQARMLRNLDRIGSALINGSTQVTEFEWPAGKKAAYPLAFAAQAKAAAADAAAAKSTAAEALAVVKELAARPAPGTVTVSHDDLVAALREVIGSVDGATPQG